jgi:hypothetical protein
MSGPFSYSPFDDASGKQLLTWLAQHGIEPAAGGEVSSPDGLSTFEIANAGLATLDVVTGGSFKLNVNAVQRLLANAAGVTSAAYNLADGSDKNYNVAVNGAGTAYALTATSAAIDFGTTDPSIVLNKAGTYLLLARASLRYTAATFAASRNVTLKLRRTNNTAADLTGGSTVLATNIVTTTTATFAAVSLPPIVYTTAVATDIITIFGDVAVVPTAGSLDAVEANIVAVRLY